MKTIEINKGGFGIASLFSKESTKEVLMEQNGIDGFYLSELGISYNTGDVIELRTPCRNLGNAFTTCKVKVYNITDKLYECEFN